MKPISTSTENLTEATIYNEQIIIEEEDKYKEEHNDENYDKGFAEHNEHHRRNFEITKIEEDNNEVKHEAFENEDTIRKKLKTDSGDVALIKDDIEDYNISEQVVNTKAREKVVTQLTTLMKQNRHLKTIQNRTYCQLAKKVENELFNECQGALTQYEYLIRYYKGIFSKIKKFKHISEFLNKYMFNRNIVLYLHTNLYRFCLIENFLKQNNVQTIEDLIDHTSESIESANNTDAPSVDNNLHLFKSESNLLLKSDLSKSIIEPYDRQNNNINHLERQNASEVHEHLSTQREEGLIKLINDINTVKIPYFEFNQMQAIKPLSSSILSVFSSNESKDGGPFSYILNKAETSQLSHESRSVRTPKLQEDHYSRFYEVKIIKICWSSLNFNY